MADFNVDVNIRTRGTEEIDALERQLDKIKSETVSIKVNTTGSSEIEKINQSVQKVSHSQKQLSNFKLKLNTQGVAADLSKIETQLNKLKTESFSESQKKQVSNLSSSYKQLSQIVSEITTKMKSSTLDTSDIERYNTALKTTQSQVKILQNDLSGVASISDRIKFSNQMEAWLNNNTKATKEAKTAIEGYIAQIKNLDTAMTTGSFNNIKSQFEQTTSAMKATGNVGKSPMDEFKRAVRQIAEFAGVYGAIQNVVFEVPRQMVQAVKDVNAAQIELTKVSDASPAQLSAYWSEATDSAEKYGAAINEVINSTADWSRLGYSLEDAKKLSNATTLMQKVGDNMTQESSSEGIISTLKGFQMEADEVNRIIDQVNEVANTQPIDTAGIFAGLERSASSMDAANNSLEQTIALITAANSVVQDPDSVGTAFKTRFCLYVQKCA